MAILSYGPILCFTIMLHDQVLPFYEEQDVQLLRVLTDRGTEYCGIFDFPVLTACALSLYHHPPGLSLENATIVLPGRFQPSVHARLHLPARQS